MWLSGVIALSFDSLYSRSFCFGFYINTLTFLLKVIKRVIMCGLEDQPQRHIPIRNAYELFVIDEPVDA